MTFTNFKTKHFKDKITTGSIKPFFHRQNSFYIEYMETMLTVIGMSHVGILDLVVLLTFTSLFVFGSTTTKSISGDPQENPCARFSFDKCFPDPSWILANLDDIAEEEDCQKQCSQMYTSSCTFYIHYVDSAQCQLFKIPQIDYLENCKEIGQPRNHSLKECAESNEPCKVRRTKKDFKHS